MVAGLEKALEKEVRLDHRVAPAHSTGTSRGKTTAADKRVALAPEVVVPTRRIPVKSSVISDARHKPAAVFVFSHVEEGPRAVEEDVLLDQVLARHGREHRTGLLGVEPEVVDEVA